MDDTLDFAHPPMPPQPSHPKEHTRRDALGNRFVTAALDAIRFRKPQGSAVTPDAQTQAAPNRTRRWFLKAGGLVAAGAATGGLASRERITTYTTDLADRFATAYHNIGTTFVEVSRDPELMHGVIASLKTALQLQAQVNAERTYGLELSANPERRTMLELIKEGIDMYKRKTGKTPFYRFSEDRKTDDYYNDKIAGWAGCIKADDVYGVLKGDKGPKDKFYRTENRVITALEEEWNAIENVHTHIRDFHELFWLEGSSFAEKANAVWDEIFLADDFSHTILREDVTSNFRNSRIHENSRWVVRQTVSEHMKHMMDDVLSAAVLKGDRLSTSFIFARYLELNDGDIAQSLIDTGIFLKILARNDLETGAFIPTTAPERQGELVERFKHIKDEFSVIGSNFAQDDARRLGLGIDPSYKDVSPVNMIGQAYHSWQIAASVSRFPVGFLQKGVIARQLMRMEATQETPEERAKAKASPANHGNVKLLSDLETLMELADIQDFLMGQSTVGFVAPTLVK